MARCPKITYDKLAEWISMGLGQGHGENYQPWLQIKRWNPSKVSCQAYERLPPYQRSCHFLSKSEWMLGVLFAWVGAEVREQYPIWPWPHPHPLYGLNSEWDGQLPWSNGLMALCANAGIEHGVFIGTHIPYIWTLDMVLTVYPINDHKPCCIVVSVKPLNSEQIQHPDPINRVIEKLEVERRYCDAMGIRYFVADSTLYPGPLLGQLSWLASAAYPLTDNIARIAERFYDRYDAHPNRYSLSEWIECLQSDFGLAKPEADNLIQHSLWHQVIDYDLSQPVSMTHAIKHGGRVIRKKIYDALMC